jgi:hypothetical protein
MSKDTNKKTAETLFASTAHNVLWANPKGEFFTSENLGALSLKTGQELEKFERKEATTSLEVSTSDTKELNANDTIAKIKEVTSLKELAQFEGDERKSVISVYGWKEKQLIEALKVVDSKAVNGNEETDGKK